MSTILVTGGTGFLGSHCILQLPRDGYEVRTTVRDLGREQRARSTLQANGVATDAPLSFVAADLLSDGGWMEAVSGCDAVLHVASPFPATQPDNADDVIIPARDGTLRVLRAARDAGVGRVVLTSSFAAVGYGRQHPGRDFDERDWTEEDAPNAPYIRSKVVAERAAWDFVAREGNGLALSVVNPTGILGPVLGADYSTSIGMVKAILEGQVPGPPDMAFGVVDVRDVADLHLRVMSSSEAVGERFIAVAGPALSLRGVARLLSEHLGEQADRISTSLLEVSLTAQEGTQRRDSSSAKARRLLDWSPRSADEAILASAQSLIRLGLVI
ncbi:aldehyde reductase [Mesorhizobium sp. RP14(2022)]|uniref:Aldehyde reductase n=1 Tax=Mesorhizobium liriopis TaxID=2953882 RepID=A0ABT1CBW0_9HYPH|nr:aldehyde reductase [Mesorhizobium liriopis]MCO6052327.1 aldehyde reductase [Mesorhizobium liriopis]